MLRFQTLRIIGCCIVGYCAIGLAANPTFADWPTYRGNFQRTSYSSAKLEGDLSLAWKYAPAQAPQPAWPAPARGSYWQQLSSLVPRVADDHAFHPIIADGIVYFGSSADDSVRAIDLASGKLLWRTTTEGPVRYAPTRVGDALLFGSDDGCVYSVDAKSGQLKWKTMLSESNRRIPGNGRLISAWPVRSSVVVESGTAYAFAGLFPSQGVYAVSLDIKNGQVEWRRKIEGSPQGYLLLDSQRLIAPMGRSQPTIFDCRNGTSLGAVPGTGGTFALVDQARIVSGVGNNGELASSDAATRRQLARFPGRHMAVDATSAYLLGANGLQANDRNEQGASKQRWQVAIKGGSCLAACENVVVAGEPGKVQVLDAKGGELLQTLTIKGTPLGVAIVEDHLVVSTDIGETWCWKTGGVDSPCEVIEAKASTLASDSKVSAALAALQLDRTPVRKGFALLVDVVDHEIIDWLLAKTDFQLVIATSDSAAINKIHDRYTPLGTYGSRIAALFNETDKLPFASRFANVVIADLAKSAASRDETVRCLNPFEGQAIYLPGEHYVPTRPTDLAAWTHMFGSPANTTYASNNTLGNSLDLQWFGGPGPQLMTDRHLRGPAPLVDAGLMIVPGENCFVGVDAFNGTIRWHLDAAGSQRYTVPLDCGYFALATGTFAVANRDTAWLVEAATGRVTEERPLPIDGVANSVWGYLAIVDDTLVGTAQLRTAGRTEPSRQQISIDYKNNQPLVTSNEVFVTDLKTGELKWSHPSAIINASISCDPDRLICVNSSDQALTSHETGRILLSKFLSASPQLTSFDFETGKIQWSRDLPAELLECTNILYTQIAGDRLIVSGSLTVKGDSLYRVAVLNVANGETIWKSEHFKGRPGAFTHGEQVHHPVVLANRLIVEPAIYDLANGDRLNLDGSKGNGTIRRPGHSCGTLTGAGDCVFFRAGNPTMLNLSTATPNSERFTKLAPSRAGCWINIVPANGLVLVPEASASCVCLYSLQTSMAFAPSEQ